tara:strand:+ start:13950 stop:14090 length:141 start_codon:yes stop_codon:yes gene_type:complete
MDDTFRGMAANVAGCNANGVSLQSGQWSEWCTRNKKPGAGLCSARL